MKKTKLTGKRLGLQAETVRNLTAAELEAVAGGLRAPTDESSAPCTCASGHRTSNV